MGLKGWKLNKKIKYRREYFGGYCWTPKGKYFKLDQTGISIIELFLTSTLKPSAELSSMLKDFPATFHALTQKNILVETNEIKKYLSRRDFISVLSKTSEHSKRKFLKPHWVHIQPFRYCNQKCIHCYCEAGNTQKKFPMSLTIWKNIVDYLENYGIWEIYITGGENFIVPECFELTSYIIEKNIDTGISTNGMHVTDKIVNWLIDSGIKRVQVSLDGSNPDVNDRIRGVPGAFVKTMEGLSKLSDRVYPVINTVINKVNYKDVESIIKICIDKGVKEFKFFPQKSSGRGRKKYLLSNVEINILEKQVVTYRDKYLVDIDWPSKEQFCGSGNGGFAIDEVGDVFPCIFGVSNKTQRLSSILSFDIDTFWFNSQKLKAFREMDSKQICQRCEKDLSMYV